MPRGALSALSKFRRRIPAASAAPVPPSAATAERAPATGGEASSPEPELEAGGRAGDEDDWAVLAASMRDAEVIARVWIDKFRCVASADRGAKVVRVSDIRVALLTQM